MNAATMRSFVKTALQEQCDSNTPAHYLMVKIAIAAKFPKLSWAGGELAGLGILAAPAASAMAGHEWQEKNKNRAEVAGLGILAAPYAHQIAAKRIPSYGASRVGQRLSQVFGHVV